MAEKLIVVRVAYHPDAKVWWTEVSDLFGLNACASSLDEFRTILPGMIQDLIALNEPSWSGHDITAELVAVGGERITIPAQRDGLCQAISALFLRSISSAEQSRHLPL